MSTFWATVPWPGRPAKVVLCRGRRLACGSDVSDSFHMSERARRLIFFSLGIFCCSFATRAQSATIAGQVIRENKEIEIHFPVGKYFQDYAAEGGNPRPTTGRAVLMFPKGFEPTRPWPILIVTSTTDGHRTSPMDAGFYERAATAEGWIVLASDATIKPRVDTTLWRLGLLAAALQAVRAEWPQSIKWPVVFAGLSGGAKRSCVLGAMLATTGSVNIQGLFLAGINEDRLTPACKEYHPPADFLNVPIWLSSGMSDFIATPKLYSHVKTSLELSGFRRVRVESFPGGHEVNAAEVQRALRWIRQVGRF